MGETGYVTDIDQFSLHDGPGIRTTVFLQGCPLSCRWCHSPETQEKNPVLLYRQAKCVCCGTCITVCHRGAVSPNMEADQAGQRRGILIDRTLCDNCMKCTLTCAAHALQASSSEKSVEEVMELLLANRPFFETTEGGITITGGEILMQPRFTAALLVKSRKAGISTAVETCGYGNGADLMELARLSDLIFYDIKHMDPEKHQLYTGQGNQVILDNLKLLCSKEGIADRIVVRVPCIPDINDDQENLTATAEFAVRQGIRYMELLPYNAAACAKYQWLGRKFLLDGAKPRSKSEYQLMESFLYEHYPLTHWKKEKVKDGNE